MNKLNLLVDSANYSVVEDCGVEDSGVEGPAARMARDKLNNASLVSVQWTVDAEEYAYLRSVYRYAEANGNPPFLIDLIIHTENVEEYIAKFDEAGLTLSEISGATFVVQAKLYAIPAVGRPSVVEYPV